MSQETLELVRKGYEAFAAGDSETLLALVDEEVQWFPVLAPLLGVGTIQGKAGLKEFLTVSIAEGLAELTATPGSVEDLGETVLVQTHYAGRGQTSDLPLELDVHSLVRFRHGKIASYWDYETRAAALEAAGLTE